MSGAAHFIVATAGHVDHGKSALVKALTGADPDRLPKKRREASRSTWALLTWSWRRRLGLPFPSAWSTCRGTRTS